MSNVNDKIWNDYPGKRLLLIALSLALVTHGVIIFFTLPKTYDAFVHIFFADHYARFWFEPWEYRWYTGFLTVSYPPFVHQAIALISNVFPLKVAFSIYAIIILEILIVGVYRFSKLFFDKTTAGVAALLVVVLSSIVETLHVFGQMPTLTGLAFLLNALPFLYQYLVKRKFIFLVMTLAFLAVVVCSHHVTAIFGMAFFIAPTIFMALTDSLPSAYRNRNLFLFAIRIIKLCFKKIIPLGLFGGGTIALAVLLIFPYWYWSKTDPISQVSIPHGSRDSFLETSSSGLVFFIIPLSLILALLPAISFSVTKQKRFIGWAAAFFLCLLLGSGGTTPLPKMLLGENAFNILTLDRFGFWASIIAIPFMAKFIHAFVDGSVKALLVKRIKESGHFILSGLTAISYLLFIVFIFHLGSFRPLQPKEIEIQPMLNFLNRDDHMRWRYLALGFGDQMAWLSANSLAATVDGNYHSARRLPELTTRPVERLENAKFSGEEGLASLTDFLSNAEKYSLKYVFNNDRYYDPLLYYSGWNRTIRLENGIMVWEKGNISTITPLPPKELSPLLKKAWGIIPISSFCLVIALTAFYLLRYKEKEYFTEFSISEPAYPKAIAFSTALLPLVFSTTFILKEVYELLLVKQKDTPENSVFNYYNHLDFQRFENAFHFFKPDPAFPLDQYLLEKSVTDGGLLPSYAKLDSIHYKALTEKKDSCLAEVFTKWKTSLGYWQKVDTIQLVKRNKNWFLLPPTFKTEIPEEQMRAYHFVLFKKQGKRVISSFPTVKDDRVKKPFAVFKQVHLVKSGDEVFITGDVLNADNIPVNIALKARLYFENKYIKDYYPGTAFRYNLAPKEHSFFQLNLDKAKVLDSLQIQKIELYADTDVSERGYIHGGSVGFSVLDGSKKNVLIRANFYNELSTEINIPALLVAEKDSLGNIWQCKLAIEPRAIRSGLNAAFEFNFKKIQGNGSMDAYPISLFINGEPRTALRPTTDTFANQNRGIAVQPHCFISQEIYLQ